MKLIQRIKEAANYARMDIIVNFKHLQLATSDAFKALVDSDAMKVAIPNVKVRFRKCKNTFEASLQGFSRAGLEHLHEGLQHA